MTMYNLTQLYNATDMGTLLEFANTTTDGLLAGLFVIGFFFIMLFVLKKNDFRDGLLASSWLSFIVSAILTFGDFLNFMFPTGFLILAGLVSLWMWIKPDSS